ncbi:MAG: hypothetical protein ACXWQO_15455 [Bdellovibrionota bacterium]
MKSLSLCLMGLSLFGSVAMAHPTVECATAAINSPYGVISSNAIKLCH